MVHRFHATWSPGGAISRLIPLLALGVLLTACHDAERSLAPRSGGRQFSLSATQAVNGKIAFHSTRDGDFQIYVMNPDGSGVARGTDGTGGSVDPILSPDGKRIAYANFHSGRSEVFVINVVGTGETQLTTDGGFPGAWSPDGTRIAFANSSDGDDEIFLMNPDGSGVTRLTDNSFNDRPSGWSPNGAQILFQSDREDGDEEIFVMNADGSGVTQLTFNDGVFDAVPVWTQLVSLSNDAFANATVISALPFSDVVDISAASMEAGEPPSSCSGGSSSQRTVWYSFTPAVTAVVRASVNAGFSTVVGVYTGGLGGLAEITCRSPFVVRDATFLAQAGTTYHIQVDGMFNQTGVVELRLEVVPPPANDLFVNATALAPLPFSDALDLTAAGTEVGEASPSCATPFGGVNGSAWYRFTPAATGSISANTLSGAFSSVVAAYL